MNPTPLRRISVIGCTGSGKTTLGRGLSQRLGVTAVDLDELNWLPGWQSRPKDEFDALLRQAIAGDGWVVSGNYTRVRPTIWARAQAVVWLDYSFPVVMGRLLCRTFRRNLTGEACCNGNYESWRRTFSRESILIWGLKTHAKRRRQYPELLAHPDSAHLQLLHFRSPSETRTWLETF